MLLYHGSNVIVDKPILLPAQRGLDFGQGFYTTTNEIQAEAFARKVCNRTQSDKGFVSIYDVPSMEELQSALIVHIFPEPDESWLDFVYENRNDKYRGDRYDLVFGPVANDTIYRTFIAYEDGQLTKQETIARLKVRKLYNQLTFCSKRAIAYLHYKDYQIIEREV
ncbi:MAG: DUF3990 domain-containing protein [Oscillospiraceae bacterium]|nr:DUF3990 domain-containing protein [Oscillospiraceae bacterium]